jgi:AraC-like DNA-binding protein
MSYPRSPRFTSRLIDATLRNVANGGGSVERVRTRAKLPPVAHFREALVDIDLIARTLECAADEIGDPCFGLNLGAKVDLRVFGTISFAVVNAATVGTALSNLIRYQSTYSRNFRCFYERKEKALAGFQLNRPASEGLRHLENLCIAVVVCNLRSLVGDRWKSFGMRFEHAKTSHTDVYEEVIGCTPQFSCERAELSIDLGLDAEAIPLADRRLLPVVKRHLEAWAGERKEQDRLSQDVRAEIARSLCDGTPTIEMIASKLHISGRTLQRRLASNKTSYSALLSEVRKKLVKEYLGTDQIGLLEISLLLGYSDLCAFNHAFRQWFDESPSSLRYRLLNCEG